jgi:hypothetical protein
VLSLFWLEFLEETCSFHDEKIKILKQEATELLAVFSTTKRKLKEKYKS